MKHLVLLLHAGNYLEASSRRQQGLQDQYRHHSYALETLERLVASGTSVTVVQMHSEHEYDEKGAEGVRFIGLGRRVETNVASTVATLLEEQRPTHVMLRSPSVEVLRQIVAKPLRVSVVLADSFPSPLRHRSRNRELGRLLTHPEVDFVANHQLNSSRQLVRLLALDPRKVIPWDWPLDLSTLAVSSARGLPAENQLRLCYVGSIGKSKGVWDIVRAVRILRRHGVDARLEVAGAGQVDHLNQLVERLGLAEAVNYRGRIGGNEIVSLMQRSTFVCVPSRHSYPEGLPLTLYEAMASGTPVIASDHPMFDGVIRDRETGFVFRAGRPGRPRRIAKVIQRGWRDAAGYEHVSSTAARAYHDLGLTTLWGDLLTRWVRDGSDDRAWLRDRSLG